MTFTEEAGIGGAGAQVRPGGLGAEPLMVIPGGDREQRGGVRADAVEGEQAGGAGSDEGDDQLVQALELAIGELGAPAQFAHRDPDGVAGDVAGAGPQRRQFSDQVRGVMLGEPGPQVL